MAPTPAQPLSLPSTLNPDQLDVVSELAYILGRLRRTQQQQQQQHAASSSSSPPTSTELSLKEIPAATDALKHKFQRARTLLKGLPDLDRAPAEQEREIAALEARIAKQRDVLLKLREVGARLAEGDGEGDRMEE
ncbi:RNA polymerase II transcription mediator complex subunit 9-domain-containing protein [Xylariomycetidae sp. FL0641]|nr:RNA polymerase II transcription mediator complex subunit 9-domain-containing protein [Xylariomycetidae sp. FL0641]